MAGSSSHPHPPTDAPDLKSFLKEAAGRVDGYLRKYIESLEGSPRKLTEAMGYSLFGPGKRVRPALVLLCYQAVGGETTSKNASLRSMHSGAPTPQGMAPDSERAAMAAAGAIEMIHCFSLIHDDLPAMDDDDLRRGRPTNHKVYGEALAILAGDGLNTMAFELIAKEAGDAKLVVALVRELGFATGPEGMIGGQVLDTCHPEEAKQGASGGDLPKLQLIHRMKTGALIRCACRMGALCGGADEETLKAIDVYGRAIGLAFQIMDDILDVTATEEQMGKKTGKDSEKGKLTYPSLVGLEKSRQYLTDQVKIADEISARLGPRAALMGKLAHELANRTN